MQVVLVDDDDGIGYDGMVIKNPLFSLAPYPRPINSTDTLKEMVFGSGVVVYSYSIMTYLVSSPWFMYCLV